jgi:hypothetical protein
MAKSVEDQPWYVLTRVDLTRLIDPEEPCEGGEEMLKEILVSLAWMASITIFKLEDTHSKAVHQSHSMQGAIESGIDHLWDKYAEQKLK